MSHETLRELDELVQEIRGDVSIYSLVTPENDSEQRELFLAGQVEEPSFTYSGGVENSSKIKRELEVLGDELEELDVEESVQRLYEDSIREGEALLDIAENVGDTGVVQTASREIYGEPSRGAINWAENILSQDPLEESGAEAVYGSDEMVDAAERTLDVLGLDWNVETSGKSIFSVNAANQTVSVPEDREFTANEMMRLPLHEIGVHAVRGANGYEQEYQVMGAGAGGYHQAEEGVALFLEEATGLSDPELKRKYAARAKSVESVINGDSFSETYEMNLGYGFEPEQAWKTAMRAHRGGRFIKDHVYAEGLRQVQAYVGEEVGEGLEEIGEMDGSLEDLLAGKISVEQADALGDEMDAEYSPLDVVNEMDYITPDSVDPSQHMDVDPRLDEWYSAAT
jgi:hypothetical protein